MSAGNEFCDLLKAPTAGGHLPNYFALFPSLRTNLDYNGDCYNFRVSGIASRQARDNYALAQYRTRSMDVIPLERAKVTLKRSFACKEFAIHIAALAIIGVLLRRRNMELKVWQFGAKVHELLMLASLSFIVFYNMRKLLAGQHGILFGLFMSFIYSGARSDLIFTDHFGSVQREVAMGINYKVGGTESVTTIVMELNSRVFITYFSYASRNNVAGLNDVAFPRLRLVADTLMYQPVVYPMNSTTVFSNVSDILIEKIQEYEKLRKSKYSFSDRPLDLQLDWAALLNTTESRTAQRTMPLVQPKPGETDSYQSMIVKFDRYGYGYGVRGATTWVATLFLLAYTLVAVVHMASVGYAICKNQYYGGGC
ncbi:hypothetical protein K458DRAFT_386829 [Lentithecium fluviatile CBS 122367]|uniref:Uncharacterized protein n=1 Tax=Lentithecium fluviatile CBS 122367 TaxID=1168545 RepID=A0A6G1J9F9_9PLEO|nr:hypothetical protein K458DRAFT_386829 [Lentithecium fluviatile CBS 122367]